MLANPTPVQESAVHPYAPTPRVRVEYSTVDDFLVDYTSNQTIGVMFIKTDYPMAVGSVFKLSIQLPRDLPPIEASAEVCWTRPHEAGEPMNAGMGVRFRGLSAVDKVLVDGLMSTWQ